MEVALKLLKQIKGAAVLCIGDIMIDHYIYGQATRISPEAPVPIVRVKKHLTMPGGVGNVVKNIWSLGAIPHTISVVGSDSSAQYLAEMLHYEGIPQPHFIVDHQRPTSVKTRLLAGIQQVVRFDEEDDQPISEEVASKLLILIKAAMPKVGAIILSDYGKGVLTPEIITEIIHLAQILDKPVVIDPKGNDYSRYQGATVVTPNRAELAEATNKQNLSTEASLIEAGHQLMAQNNLKNLLITRSEDGVMLLSNTNTPPALWPSLAREVFDVSGAGDTIVAVIAATLAVKAPLTIGAKLANLAAGVVVGKVGTATATPEEITAWAKKSPRN